MDPIKILILTANPKIPDYDPLRLDAEVRRIEEALQRSRYRDRFEIAIKLAVRTIDLTRALLDHRPQIIHFSGHGTGEPQLLTESSVDPEKLPNTEALARPDTAETQIVPVPKSGVSKQGLVLENDAGKMQLVSTEALAKLFSIFKTGDIECVLLNACYSEIQATAIHQFVDCVIGMSQAIGDKAALQFAEGFYDALGAGSPYDEAFEIGCSTIALTGSPEYIKPVLKYRQRRPVNLPRVQAPASAPAPKTVDLGHPSDQPTQSQSIGNITISGSNNPFSVIQAADSVIVNQSQIQTQATHPDRQAALVALGSLKQAIATTNDLDETEKAMAVIPVRKLETELQKTEPDRSVLGRTIATLKKTLDGVIALAEPVTQVAALVAKVEVSSP